MENISWKLFEETLDWTNANDMDVFTSLVIHTLIEKQLFPEELLTRIGADQRWRPDDLLPFLETLRGRRASLLRVRMISIDSRLKFDVLISRYSPTSVKLAFLNTSLNSDTQSIILNSDQYILKDDESLAVSKGAYEEFSGKVLKLFEQSIVRDWHHYLYKFPTLVSESTTDIQAEHLVKILQRIERDPQSQIETIDRENLVGILLCVFAERGILHEMITEYRPEQNNSQPFCYNKNLCKVFSDHFNTIGDSIRQLKMGSVLKFQMEHESSLAFNVLVANYGNKSFKVTVVSVSNSTLTGIFDTKSCWTIANGALEINYSALRKFAQQISDSLLYPILTGWWQQQQWYTRLPYLLGIPENCLHKIRGYLVKKKDWNNFRSTSRRIGMVVKPRAINK